MHMMYPITEIQWLQKLHDEFNLPYMRKLASFLSAEEAKGIQIFPPANLRFNAFCQTPLDQVKVVIMGQDPYHGPGQAHGLAFSVPRGIFLPPSLKNIFKELASDVGLNMPSHGCLDHWAKQGVLLLNATLSVRSEEPKSHYGQGWEQFTDRVISILAERPEPIVFMLWGRSALEKFQRLTAQSSRHLILTSVHPSPLSAYRGFFGCRHFSRANTFLKEKGQQPIDWAIH